MELINYYQYIIKFLSKLLNLDEQPNLIVAKNNTICYNEKNLDFKYEKINAKFYTESSTIYINLDLHNLKTHDEIFSLIHEFRHFYQFKQILKYPNEISEEKNIIKRWQSNFDNYINFGNDGYYEQDIEIDANVFTIYIVLFLFKKPCYINNEFDKKKIAFYYSLYEKKYTNLKMNKILNKMGFDPFKLFKL